MELSGVQEEVAPRSDDALLSQLEAESKEPSPEDSKEAPTTEELETVPLPEKEENEKSESGGVLPLLDTEGTAKIQGEVFGASGEGLPGVIVSIPRLDETTRADQEGKFSFSDLPAGELKLNFNKLGYKVGEQTVVLKDGQTSKVSQSLEERPVEFDDAEYELDEVDVVGEFIEDENDGIDIEIDDAQRGLKLEGIVGRAEFAQKNLRDVSEAVEKVSGANIVEGGRAVVRGLADRYVTTLFAGSSVSTTSPFRKAVSLDLFPTSAVEDIRVAKIYNATLPGDFGGATIDITPRRFPQERVLDFQLRASFDEIDAGDDFLVNSGEGLDFFGNAPFVNFVDQFFAAAASPTPEGQTAGLIDVIQSRSFLPKRDNQQNDLSFTFNYGDSFKVGAEGKLGVVYSLRRQTADTAILNSFQNNIGAGTFNADRFSRQVTLNNSLGLTWQINRSNEIAFNYFRRQNGENQVNDIFNFSGGFGIEPGIETTGQIFENAGNNVVEVVGGSFLNTAFIENTYEIVRGGGRHKIFGHDLDDEEGALLEWSISRSENQIDSERSTLRRLEIDFNSPGVIAAATPLDITLDAFTASTDLFSNFSGTAGSTFVTTGSPLDFLFPNRVLSAAQFAQVMSFGQLRDALEAAGASAGTLASFDNLLDDSFESAVGNPLPTDPSRGTQFTIDDGASPSELDSFRETTTQFERTENIGVDLTFPFKLGRSGKSKLVLRTGADFERRERVENTEEIRIQLPANADIDGFAIGTDPDNGFASELTDGDPNDLEILPFVSDAGENLVRQGTLEQTIASLYGDAEWSWEKFVLRVGARRERVRRTSIIPAFGGDLPTTTTEANLFGASASYTLSNGINFLVGYSTTVARPIIKELLPFPQIDRSTGETLLGSSELSDSSITNIDFAVTFPKTGRFSGQANLFQKRITDPILRFRSGSTTVFGNGEVGTIAGIELEGRVDLPFGLSWDTNYAFIQGDLDFISLQDGATLSSTFPEQPSQIFNTSLSYRSEDYGLNANLSLNIVSEFVEQLPANAQAPFLQRQPAPQLDFNITKAFDLEFGNLILGFSVENILSSDDSILFISTDDNDPVNETTQTSIDRGRRFSVWGKMEF